MNIHPTGSSCCLQQKTEDLRHMICGCTAYHQDRVSTVELLKQTIMQEAGLCTRNLHCSAWDILLRVLVCPDIIDTMIPELVPVIPKIEQISRDYLYKIHVKRLRLQQNRLLLAFYRYSVQFLVSVPSYSIEIFIL